MGITISGGLNIAGGMSISPPPAAPVDPYLANVSLLSSLTGTVGAAPTVDLTNNSSSLIGFGTAPTISNLQSKWSTTSLYYPSSGTGAYADSVSPPVNTDLTIEAWLYPVSNGNRRTFFGNSQYNNNNGPGMIVWLTDAGELQAFDNYGSNQRNSGLIASNNAWNHVAYSRVYNGTSWTHYLACNGSVYPFTFPGSAQAGWAAGQLIYLGAAYSSGLPFYYSGDMNDFRVTVGVARYTSSYTVPTVPFPTS